jgi:UDP-2-acetamido-3-amino-2,3-dideoxy-glucuronate N-acetyltransferase
MFALMVGVPARRIGWMSRAGKRDRYPTFRPRDGSRYRRTNDGLLEQIL